MFEKFFFNDPATTDIYTLSLHEALPICGWTTASGCAATRPNRRPRTSAGAPRTPRRPSPEAPAPERRGSAASRAARSEEHTSELQSRQYLVCRFLFEKKYCDTTPPPTHS